MAQVQIAVERRNFLAHRFWFERAHLLFDDSDILGLVAELDQYTDEFRRVKEQTSKWFEPKKSEFGISAGLLDQIQHQILSGELEEPYPDKKKVRELEKKLKKTQRLLRVWEFGLPDGSKPLIFELEDGTLWQLCDVGLSWTKFQQVEPAWMEQPLVNPIYQRTSFHALPLHNRGSTNFGSQRARPFS